MSIVWKIYGLDADVVQGAITNAHWEVIAFQWVDVEDGEDGERVMHKERFYGSELLSEADTESEGFIPWESVTEEVAIDWVKESLGAEKVSDIEKEITEALQKQITPTEKTDLPWGDI